MLRSFTLIGEAFGEAAAQKIVRALRVIRVVTVGFLRESDVQAMVDVVVPLRIEVLRTTRRAQISRLVLAVLEHEMNLPRPAPP